jgi:pyruvate/2-oxoacid:ferredoxin oxidoreductase alpha subunit/NAD-dependent dihydropyrimidine dehydrogenase PreA subunit
MPETKTRSRPKPFVMPQFCKACGRCLDACPKGCIELGTEIEPLTGFTPIVLNLDACSGCGLCFSACPEPFGLQPVANEFETELFDPAKQFGVKPSTAPQPVAIPDLKVALPQLEPMILKGNHAAAVGAILAGCRHFFGYPITPSTEGAELMAKLLPQLDGVFVQAVSEVATINMMYGCSGAGLPCMSFTSSPGMSLMIEGISYMVGAELPAVVVNVMRGGPGLGNIAPEQADIKLLCRGLGHGNSHAIVLAPSTPQEMLNASMLAFELAFKYRNPVVIAGDGYLGQMTGRVSLPEHMVKPGLPEWAVWGDEMHRGNLISSIYLSEPDLENHNIHINEKYDRIWANEQRSDNYFCDDAEWIVIACNTPARMAKGAIQQLREQGAKVGLFRPVTLWPFPIDSLRGLLGHAQGLLVVEGSNGQLEDELRLALSHADAPRLPIENLRHFGGILPSQDEIVNKLRSLVEVAA